MTVVKGQHCIDPVIRHPSLDTHGRWSFTSATTCSERCVASKVSRATMCKASHRTFDTEAERRVGRADAAAPNQIAFDYIVV